MLSLNQKINLRLLKEGIVAEDDDMDKNVSTKYINTDDTDRQAMLRAMENTGHSVSSLAADTDVQPSMISRLLRKPRSGNPDESARNPSIKLAAKIEGALNTSVEALFPDIFDTSRPDKSRGKGRGKAKSGRSRKSSSE